MRWWHNCKNSRRAILGLDEICIMEQHSTRTCTASCKPCFWFRAQSLWWSYIGAIFSFFSFYWIHKRDLRMNNVVNIILCHRNTYDYNFDLINASLMGNKPNLSGQSCIERTLIHEIDTISFQHCIPLSSSNECITYVGC